MQLLILNAYRVLYAIALVFAAFFIVFQQVVFNILYPNVTHIGEVSDRENLLEPLVNCTLSTLILLIPLLVAFRIWNLIINYELSKKRTEKLLFRFLLFLVSCTVILGGAWLID